MLKPVIIVLSLIVILSLVLYQDAKFIVGPDEQVIMTQFEKIEGDTIKKEGIYYKIPYIQKVHYYQKSPHIVSRISELPTNDKIWILVESRFVWQIVFPENFHLLVQSPTVLNNKLEALISSEARNFVTQSRLEDLIGKNNRLEKAHRIKGKNTVEQEILKMGYQITNKVGIKIITAEIWVVGWGNNSKNSDLPKYMRNSSSTKELEM